jgi:hypothetical protein
MRSLLLGGLAFFLSVTTAAAAFNYESQTRNLSASVGFGPENNDFQSTSATGPWSAIVFVSRSDPGGGGATASGSQTSNLGSDLIAMSGSLSAGSTSSAGGTATSQMFLTFTFASDTYYVSAVTTTGDEVNGSNGVSFYPAGGGSFINPNSNGVLPAGEYALNITFGVGSPFNGGTSSGTYDYSLSTRSVTPEPSSVCVWLAVLGALFATEARRRHCRR